MEAIKETVTSVMQRLKKKKSTAGDKDPNGLLKKTLTKKELKHIKFNYLKKGILSLHVDSSAWLYNFSLQKQDLITRLNKHFRSINDIRFYIGETK
jgi:predicted transcriptional regulator